MAPEVLARKVAYLRQLLVDLRPYETATLDQVRDEHYKLERIFELLVMTATDILNHLLSEQNIIANTYRETYQRAAEQQMIPNDLATRLQDAASMRNLIVHLYERIDYSILRDSINPAIDDFQQLVAILEQQINDEF